MKRIIIFIVGFLLLATPIYAEDGDNSDVPSYLIFENEEHIKQKDFEYENKTRLSIMPYGIVNRKLNVQRIEQQNGWYCGPASVQMVLRYLGISLIQNQIAEEVKTTETDGTATIDISDFLREKTKYNYVTRSTSSKPLWYVQNTLDDGKPVIYNLRPYYVDGRYKKSTLHFVVGNGYSYNNSYLPSPGSNIVAISSLFYVDPYRTGVTSASYGAMLSAINNAWGYYIY